MAEGAAVATDESHSMDAGLVISATGYLPRPIEGVPFDDSRHLIPNTDGRVTTVSGGEVLPRVYVVGWAKRGASGGIGRNRFCAAETASRLIDDALAGIVTPSEPGRSELLAMLRERGVAVVDDSGGDRIDNQERSAGQADGRPRVKITSIEDLLEAAR